MQVKQSDIVLTMLLSCGDKLPQPMSLPGVCCCLFHATVCVCVYQENKDQQWKRAMDYLSAISELNYMTQIVIMLYEDNNKVRDVAVG